MTTNPSQLSLDFSLTVCPNIVKMLKPILQSNVVVDIIKLVETGVAVIYN
jgi:hypothetical protein